MCCFGIGVLAAQTSAAVARVISVGFLRSWKNNRCAKLFCKVPRVWHTTRTLAYFQQYYSTVCVLRYDIRRLTGNIILQVCCVVPDVPNKVPFVSRSLLLCYCKVVLSFFPAAFSGSLSGGCECQMRALNQGTIQETLYSVNEYDACVAQRSLLFSYSGSVFRVHLCTNAL